MGLLASPQTLGVLRAEVWDLLVIGGGLTGAAVMREAARRGLRVLLVERRDFAEGTSSRSSKLIHGGLHYLARGHVGLTRAMVRERERLLRTTDGLVAPVEFLVPHFAGERTRRWGVAAGLGLYEACAGRRRLPHHLDRAAVERHLAGLAPEVMGAFAYGDAGVDDARLVFRLLREGRRFGGHALHYVAASGVMRSRAGRVVGAVLRDSERGDEVELRARAVVNAAGPWVDGLRAGVGGRDRVRRVRGSHLVFSGTRLPIDRAVAVRHPDSDEAFCAVPWEGATIVGTTNVDEVAPTPDDPRASEAELAYLLRGARWLFPSLDLDEADILSTFAGERAIVDRTTRQAAMASRDYAIWDDAGMVTVVGGKLTTSRSAADKALERLGSPPPCPATSSQDGEPTRWEGLPFDPETAGRLYARYGRDGLEAIARMPAAERCPIPRQRVLWGELRWAARHEDVRHLTDLLLRRVRLGLTTAEGGRALLGSIRPVVQAELGWDDNRWEAEVRAYTEYWQRAHAVVP